MVAANKSATMSSTNPVASAMEVLEVAHASSDDGPNIAYNFPLATEASRTSTAMVKRTRIDPLSLLVRRPWAPRRRLFEEDDDDDTGVLVTLRAVTCDVLLRAGTTATTVFLKAVSAISGKSEGDVMLVRSSQSSASTKAYGCMVGLGEGNGVGALDGIGLGSWVGLGEGDIVGSCTHTRKMLQM